MKSFALQTALMTRLAAYSALTALVSTRIYDRVPDQAGTFPYVVIGEDTVAAWDAHDTVGAEHTVTIHSWSDYRGMKETKQIQEALHGALHRYALPVTGATTVNCAFEFSEAFLDPDGIRRHGVMRLRVTLDGV